MLSVLFFLRIFFWFVNSEILLCKPIFHTISPGTIFSLFALIWSQVSFDRHLPERNNHTGDFSSFYQERKVVFDNTAFKIFTGLGIVSIVAHVVGFHFNSFPFQWLFDKYANALKSVTVLSVQCVVVDVSSTLGDLSHHRFYNQGSRNVGYLKRCVADF